ncbi:MAG TPA: OmpA family protein [Burkholderiales bacterium]|nr:OmpA family protein [Burkholderiales bacterium]
MSIGRHARSAALVTLFAAAGCVSQGEFDKLQSDKNQEIASLQSSRSTLEQQVRSLESQRASLEKERDSLTGEKERLTKEKDSLTQQVAALEAQRAQLQASEKQSEARYDALLANLSEEVKKGQLQVRQLKGMLTVDVAEQLFFDSGRAALKDTGKQVLQKVAESIKGYEDKAIRIVGHTDNVPITGGLQKVFPSNWELSAARATTVVRFLQDNGIAPERLVATGRAEYAPVAPNDSAEGRQKNRRIEITLIDRGVLQ